MFSREFLRKSSQLARRVPANQRTCARTLFKQSEGSDSLPVAASLSRSSFGGSNNGDHKSGEAFLKFLLRSVASGVVIIGSSLSFSYWYPSSVDKCSFVSFADSADDAAWVSSDDLLPHKKKKRFLFGDSYRRRVFFNYEKRIRLQSPPEKVFEYFASFKTPDGEVLMTPEDLMRAVVPVFPPSESNRVREGFLRGETVPGKLHCAPSKFFMLFDTNSDGLISFPEYIFFVTLLSIPESSFSVAFKMFDLKYFTGIDLSCNNLSGEIPVELGNLISNIKALNLSHNSLTGRIPSTFSNLKDIESLDLSYNNLNGEIPRQLINLYSLSVFIVAHNNLSGKTPEMVAQFSTFISSCYEGNLLLCGPPLAKNCTGGTPPSPVPRPQTHNKEENSFIDMGAFMVTFSVAYIMVLLAIGSVLYINPSWRRAWFHFIGESINNCYYFLVDNLPVPARFRRFQPCV